MVRMDEEASKEHDSTNGEATLDYWQVEIPLDPSRMVRAADLSSVLAALEKVKCQPGPRTLVVNAVKISKGEVDHAQVIVLDALEPPRISCALTNLFPSAPLGSRVTLLKRYSEFLFKPNATASDWLDAGKLELQVRIIVFNCGEGFYFLVVSVLVRMEWIKIPLYFGLHEATEGLGCGPVHGATSPLPQ